MLDTKGIMKTAGDKSLSVVEATDKIIDNIGNISPDQADMLIQQLLLNTNNRFLRKPIKSIEWNNCDDDTVISTHRLNQQNAWVTDRVNVTGDRVTWSKMSDNDKIQYIRTFVVLSRIDSEQALIGMDELADNSPCPYTAAVFRYQSGMEVVHSESYNRQLATLISTAEELKHTEWANNSEEVDNVIGYLINRIIQVKYEENKEVSFLLQTAFSTVLESYLFYLLFYYPLYEANVKNRMTRCAEVIRLILRDESVHGAFSGYIFRKYLAEETEETQEYVKTKIEEFMDVLYSRVEVMLKAIYTDEFVIADIQRFANYNFNRTLSNLGYAPVFTGNDINFHPALQKEVDEGTDVTHDMFSMVGNVYFMMEHEPFTEKHQETIDTAIKNRSKLVNVNREVHPRAQEYLQKIMGNK